MSARVVAIVAVVGIAAVLSGCSDGSRTAPTPSSVVSTTTSLPASGADTAAVSNEAVPNLPPPYIDHVQWVETSQGSSLHVIPTPNGRAASGAGDVDIAWREVVADGVATGRTADTPGMFAQFNCHWTWARLVEPDKPSWNLEPWRPVVDESTMVATRCNPGGPEE